MITKISHDVQYTIMYIVGTLSCLPLRATNKEMKEFFDCNVPQLRYKKMWDVNKLRFQVPWNYLRNIDNITQEERNIISEKWIPVNRPPSVLRQNAIILEFDIIQQNLVRFGVEEARDPGWYIQDYIFIEDVYEEEVFVIMFDEQYEDEVYFEEIFMEESYEALPIIEEEYIVSLERLDEPVIFAHTNELLEVFEFEIIREELEDELRNDERDEEELVEALEEIEEWFEEELEELQEADEVFETTESSEELLAEAEEESTEEVNEEKSSVRVSALDVVASTIQSARNSVSSSCATSPCRSS